MDTEVILDGQRWHLQVELETEDQKLNGAKVICLIRNSNVDDDGLAKIDENIDSCEFAQEVHLKF